MTTDEFYKRKVEQLIWELNEKRDTVRRLKDTVGLIIPSLVVSFLFNVLMLLHITGGL